MRYPGARISRITRALAEPSLCDTYQSKSRPAFVHPVSSLCHNYYHLDRLSAGTRVDGGAAKDRVVLAEVMLAAAPSTWPGEYSSLLAGLWRLGQQVRCHELSIYGIAFAGLLGEGTMDRGGKWRCLRHGDTLALVQWLLCRTKTLLRLSVHPICSQVEPPVLMELELLRTFCLSEAVLMASGSWHRGSELFLRCIYHVRIPETHQLCFECNLWSMDMVAGLVGGYLSPFPRCL